MLHSDFFYFLIQIYFILKLHSKTSLLHIACKSYDMNLMKLESKNIISEMEGVLKEYSFLNVITFVVPVREYEY